MKIYKKILMMIFMVLVTLLLNKVYAAEAIISVNKQEVEVGSTFTVTITGTGAASYDIKASVSGAGISDTINLNAYTDDLSNATKKTSKTYTAKQKGTVSISIKSGSNVTVSGGKKSQPITGSEKNVTIIDKKPIQQEQPSQKPTQTTPTNNKTTNNKDTKTEKTKTPVVETKEKEEAASEFGIHALKLIGVKETKEEVELALDKAFNIKSYEYVCNISNDIKTVKIEKEAYEYNDLVQITGLEEELKVGENNIFLKLAKDGKEIIYHIKIIKEEPKQEEVIETNTTVEDKKETIMVSIPLIWFIVLELFIVILSVGTTIVVINYLKQNHQNIKNKKQTKGKDEEKEFKKI